MEIDLDRDADKRIVIRQGGVTLVDVKVSQWALLTMIQRQVLPCCHYKRLEMWAEKLETGCGDPECCS